MTSLRFHYRPPAGEGTASGTLFVRIIHNRKYRDVRQDYGIYPHEWDAGAGWLRPGVSDPARAERLREIEVSMKTDLLRLEGIVKQLSAAGEYSVGDVVAEFQKTGEADTVLSFSIKTALDLTADGRVRTARAYRSAAKSLLKFNNGRDMLLCEITGTRMREYERWLLDRGLQMNTVSFYMRNLRALYYRAVAAKVTNPTETNPFQDVYTGVYETRRRSLDRADINALASVEKKLPSNHALRPALLYFLFAYHARGMSFIDLAYLKKSDIKNGSIIYKRKKTGFYIEVKVTKPMKRIIDGFKSATKYSPFIFPIIDSQMSDYRIQYESALNRQNKALKELASMAGIEKNLSTHVARHTWATLAKRMGFGINLISEGLGHRDTKVTSIYLASFERSALDELSVRMSRAVGAA